MSKIENRVDMIGYITVKNSNLNGDIDAENMPRQDEDGYGIATDVCLKRSIRDNVALLTEGNDGYGLYIANDNIAMETKNNNEISSLGGVKALSKLPGIEAVVEIKKSLCKNYFDIRAFGAVITGLTKIVAGGDGQILGPVQLTFAESLEPIMPQQITISRVNISTEKELKEKSHELGKKWVVPYAVYKFKVFVNPMIAEKTGFSKEDLDILIEAIKSMYDNKHTSSKNDIEVSNLFVFNHESKLGNCPISKLDNAITVSRNIPEFGKSSYDITLDRSKLPNGISVQEL